MRRAAFREYLKGALWAMPSLAVVVALAAGSILSLVNIPADSRWAPILFQGTADDARSLLIGIAGTMITVIALVLGLTVVALQLASTQFSPRLLRNFLRDLTNQLTLSSFVATFAYSTAGLYTVGVSAGRRTDEFPRLAVSGALVLLFISLLMLVFFVHHLAHSIQIDQVMADVESATLHVVHDSLAPGNDEGGSIATPAQAVAVAAMRSGYVQTFHLDELVLAAEQHDLVVSVVPMIGEHVIAGAPLAWVWPVSATGPLEAGGRDVATGGPELATGGPELGAVHEALAHGIRLGFERTAEQDVAFGVRQLADIASKALSPAINDPYTAVQAVDHLSVILAALAARPLGGQTLTDSSGTTRVRVPGRDWDYFLDLGIGQVRRYGHTEPRVVIALLRVARDLAHFCDPGRRASVRAYVAVLLEDVERDVVQSADRDPLIERGRRLLSELSD